MKGKRFKRLRCCRPWLFRTYLDETLSAYVFVVRVYWVSEKLHVVAIYVHSYIASHGICAVKVLFAEKWSQVVKYHRLLVPSRKIGRVSEIQNEFTRIHIIKNDRM